MRIAAALFSASLLAGAAVGAQLADPPYLAASFLILLSIAAAASTWRGERRAVFATAVACGAAAGGALRSADEWQRAWRPPLRLIFEERLREERAQAFADGRRLPEEPDVLLTIEGTLRTDASFTDSGVSLSLAVDRVASACGADARLKPSRSIDAAICASEREGFSRAVGGGVTLTVVGDIARGRIDEWRAGRRVRMPALLRRPARYLDPGVPDFERALARRGTTLVGTVKSGALVELIEPGGWWTERLGAVRAFGRRAIASHVGRWSEQSSAIVTAIVIGDRSALDPDVQRRLQEAGTYHVIAISGGNIAILAGVLFGAFRAAGWLGRPATLAAIAVLTAYAQLVGGGASVDRATMMALVHLSARLFDQRSPPLNVLAVAAAALVASAPLSIVDPAFLLTFGATLAIIVVVPVAQPARGPRIVRGAVSMLLASAAAEALLLPLGARLFARVTFAGLVLNLAAIPLMAIAQVAGMALVPISLVSDHAAAVLGWAAHAGADGLVQSAGLVRFAPMVVWRVAPPALLVCAVYYVAVAAAWIGWRVARRLGTAETTLHRLARHVACGVAIASAAWILVEPPRWLASRGDGRLHITFIDVGQGDAAFVVFPHGATLLVDAGGLGFQPAFDIGDRVVAPLIRDAGFRRIDRLAVTHGDPDHAGGALSIVREFRPRDVWEGIPVPRAESLTRLRVEAASAGARWSNVYAGDTITIDGVVVTALNPEPADWERQKVRNDDSLVLELRWRDVSVVLTGDIGRVPESRIAPLLRPAAHRIVKIPHHGSLTSSTRPFVEALRPTIAVVSAGRSNHFGHPVPEVLERYESAGARVFRTDRDGAVMVETDGRTVGVRTFVGSQ